MLNKCIIQYDRDSFMNTFFYTIIAVLVFFCLLGLVDLNEKNAELAELKEVKLKDCKFNKGAHSHTWKNACLIHKDYVQVL
jgi:hypothetical protein